MRAKEDIEKQLQEQKLALEEQKKRYEEMEVRTCFHILRVWPDSIIFMHIIIAFIIFYILPLINYCFPNTCMYPISPTKDKLFWNSNITKD